MEDAASESEVHPVFGHSVARRWHTPRAAHYDEGNSAVMRTVGDQQEVLVNFNKVTFELWLTASWSVVQKKQSDGAAAVWQNVTPGMNTQLDSDCEEINEGKFAGEGDVDVEIHSEGRARDSLSRARGRGSGVRLSINKIQ
jgi:hypothetical protein